MPQKHKKLVDTRYAKGSNYQKIIRDIQKEKVCPFCPKTFKWHTNPILKTEQGWLITRNFNPYSKTRDHFLVIGQKHKERITELTPKDFAAILKLIQWATTKFSLLGGLLALRFGDTEYTGATVSHLHAHLVIPEKKDGKVQIVNFPIG